MEGQVIGPRLTSGNGGAMALHGDTLDISVYGKARCGAHEHGEVMANS
jgi:hypothetical protein